VKYLLGVGAIIGAWWLFRAPTPEELVRRESAQTSSAKATSRAAATVAGRSALIARRRANLSTQPTPAT
jgi:hypothetical protein